MRAGLGTPLRLAYRTDRRGDRPAATDCEEGDHPHGAEHCGQRRPNIHLYLRPAVGVALLELAVMEVLFVGDPKPRAGIGPT